MSVELAKWEVFISIGIGGALGAVSRYSISLLPFYNGFPIATLLCNLIGCFLLAYLSSSAYIKGLLPVNLVLGLSTGFIGSFTTFSTFAVDFIVLINTNLMVGMGYLLFSITLGILLCFLGVRLGIRKDRTQN